MNNQFEFLVYKSADEDITVNAIVKDETIWLSQKAMAELFDVETSFQTAIFRKLIKILC